MDVKLEATSRDDAEVRALYEAFIRESDGPLGDAVDLEAEIAAGRGCHAVRLDSSDYLTEAIGLYRSAGYPEVPAYNQNDKANLWFERQL